MSSLSLPKSVTFNGGDLYIIDQTKLPGELIDLKLQNVSQVWDAIKTLKVRGAPAIGIAGAYGLLIGLKPFIDLPVRAFKEKISDVATYLNSARPTAVNLSWALEKMISVADSYNNNSSDELFAVLTMAAVSIHRDDAAICTAIGYHGAALLTDGIGVLTHCNAGALAVSELGTALAPIYIAQNTGKKIRVYADETRPLLQGARLTAWELMKSGVDVTLICDNMAADVMSKGLVNIVITGCDRVARNGDTANKIGTLGVAILAKHFNIPFYIACPSSTYDPDTGCGKNIVIEERAAEEVTCFAGVRTAPIGVKVLNPAFDVTPAELISGFITDKGIIKPPFSENLIKSLR